MPTVEVVSTNTIRHSKRRNKWGIPDDVRWVGKPFDILNHRIVTKSIPLIP
jgi:hypothetical protein